MADQKKERAARATTRTQSIEAALIPDALLDVRTVGTLAGMGRTNIYIRCKAGTFPQPIRLSKRCTRWRSGDVMAWLQSQAAAV